MLVASEAMDKICRGSQVGEAHTQGSWADNVADTSRTARGTYVTHLSHKLETTSPRCNQRQIKRDHYTSDTFRSQDWFRHDTLSKTPDMPQLSPRFWKGANALSPAPSPRSRARLGSSKSTRALSKAGQKTEESYIDEKSPRGPVRSRSEGLLSPRSTVNQYNAISPRDTIDNVTRPGRPRPRVIVTGPDEGSEACSEARRGSPTFRASEAWMGYSSPRNPPHNKNMFAEAKDGALLDPVQPRRLQGRALSGRITEQSEDWRAGVDDYEKNSSAPVIANSINFVHSKGKKTNITKDEANAKRRLMLDPSQQDLRRSERRHDFPEQLEPPQHMSPNKSSILSKGDHLGGGRSSPRAGGHPVVVDAQHRTSAEMAASIMPGMGETHQFGAATPKYMVGNEIVHWSCQGRRSSPKCMQTAAQVNASSCEQADIQSLKLVSAVHLRDHRNSDTVREHLQPTSAYEQVQQPVQAVPQIIPPQARTPATFSKLDHIYTYGDISSLPSTMSKDSAYTHSGLNVVKYGARTPGTFSPHTTRSPVRQALAC